MAEEVGSLEIGQDLTFQRREWRVQRVGWSVILLIVIAGLIGLLGLGPLGWADATVGPLSVTYQRFVRRSAPAEFEVRVAPEAIVDDAFALRLGGSFIDHVDMEQPFPAPDAMDAAADHVVYRFTTADASPARVRFMFQPRDAGPARIEIGVNDAVLEDLDVIVFP